jgi:tetratricopeptide (TPR) repeat protein
MQIKIYSAVLLFFLLWGSFESVSASDSGSGISDEYYRLKSSGRYIEAFRYLAGRLTGIADHRDFEYNLFHLNELPAGSEISAVSIPDLEKIEGADAVKQNYFLRARLLFIKNRMFLAAGRTAESAKILDELQFQKFSITGPFSSSSLDEFDTAYPPEKGYKPDGVYQGKKYSVRWFSAPSDMEGTVNAGNFMDETTDSLYYLYTEKVISEQGDYILAIGKTGAAEVKINGAVVFQNRERHSFSHDQYFVKVSLMPGTHKIMVKCADSADGIRFSLRLTSNDGGHVSEAGNPPDLNMTPVPVVISTGYFHTLNFYTVKNQPSPEESFRAGYLIYASGIGSENNGTLLKYFSDAAQQKNLTAEAYWYSALSENDPEARDEFLKKSLKADAENIEAAAETVRIKIKNGFFNEAYMLLQVISEADSGSPLYPQLMLDYFYEKGWLEEAEKWIEKTGAAGSNYAAGIYSASIMAGRKRYSEAAVQYRNVYNINRNNFTILEAAVSSYEYSGDPDAGLKLLYSASENFPDRVALRISIARIIKNISGPRASLPSLAAAGKLSPYNKNVLTATALAYDSMGRKDLAAANFKLASLYDPDNFSIKRYLDIYASESDISDNYTYDGEISLLNENAGQYKEEPVVVLLEEKIIRVNSDGSFVKKIRNTVRINDTDAASNFNYQYAVYDPDLETVENIKCVTIDAGVPAEITEKFSRNLSDTDSRLYYNLKAVVVPVKTINTGTVIDFSYTIKNRGGSVYKNYFGEKFTIGSKYRTIKTNIVLIHPDSRKIYNHTRGIDSEKISRTKIDSNIIYSLTTDNLPPYKDEPAMPHYSAVVPAVYFSSLKNWNEFYVYYRSLLNNKIKMTPSMIEDLNTIISDSDSQEMKAAKIYDFITSGIRYVGFEFGLGGIQPRGTDLTYQSKMGDCKDVSLLLSAFLRQAGIDSSIALVRTKDKGAADLSIPYVGEFNHAICYVKLDDGREFFIDGTSRSSGCKELPSDDRNISALVIDDRDSASSGGRLPWKFVNTDTGFYDRQYEEVTTDVQLNNDGSVIMKRALVKYGTPAASIRESLKDADAQSRSLTEYWNRLYPGSSVSGLEIISSEKNRPSAYVYNIDIKSFSSVDTGSLIFIPFFNRSDYFGDYAVSKERRFPLIFSDKTSSKLIFRYTLPEGYKVTVPESEKFTGQKVKAAFTYSLSENVLEVISEITFLDYSIMPEEYPEFREFAAFVQRKELEKVVLLKNK